MLRASVRRHDEETVHVVTLVCANALLPSLDNQPGSYGLPYWKTSLRPLTICELYSQQWAPQTAGSGRGTARCSSAWGPFRNVDCTEYFPSLLLPKSHLSLGVGIILHHSLGVVTIINGSAHHSL